MDIKKLYVVFGILLLIIPSIANTLNYDNVTAEDWNRHAPWIKLILDGNLSQVNQARGGYPPAFHLFMIPGVLVLGFENIKYFQIIIAFLSCVSLGYVAYKLEGSLATALLFFMLATSSSYLQQSTALIPQTLDYIVFPLVMYCTLKKRYVGVSLGLLILIYNHLFGAIYFLVILLWSLAMDRKILPYLLVVLLLSMPVIYSYYLQTFTDMLNPVQEFGNWRNDVRETHQIWYDDWSASYTYPMERYMFFSGFIMWLLTPLTIWQMWKQKKFSREQFFYVLWTICFIPVCYFQIWRATGFVVISYSLFQASVLRRWLDDRKQI